MSNIPILIVAIIGAALLLTCGVASAVGAINARNSSNYSRQTALQDARKYLSISSIIAIVSFVILFVIVIVIASTKLYTRVFSEDEDKKKISEKEQKRNDSVFKYSIISAIAIITVVAIVAGILATMSAIQLGGLSQQDNYSNRAHVAAIIAAVSGIGGIILLIICLIVFVYFTRPKKEEKKSSFSDLRYDKSNVRDNPDKPILKNVNPDSTFTNIENTKMYVKTDSKGNLLYKEVYKIKNNQYVPTGLDYDDVVQDPIPTKSIKRVGFQQKS